MDKRLNSDEYVLYCYKILKEYITGIQDGSIITNKWIKLAVKLYLHNLERKDLELKLEKVAKVLKFMSICNLNIDNKYRQFIPAPYQMFLIYNLFLFYYKDTDERLYDTALLFIGRKNGKSAFAALLSIYFLLADGQTDPQSILLAYTRDQTHRVFDFCEGIIKNTPELKKRLTIKLNKINLKDRKQVGFLETVPSKDKSVEGYNISAAILDEIHTYTDEKLYTVTEKSTSARTNSMILMITSAGTITDSFANEYVNYAKSVLTGDIEDDSLFPMVYTLDDKDDPNDEKNWIKSNPGLGTIKKLRKLRKYYREAKFLPSVWNEFIVKDLNVFYGSSDQWIGDEYLNKVAKKVNEKELLGRNVFLGLDLSSTKDLASIVCLFPDDEGKKFISIPYFFFANQPSKKVRKGGINLVPWIKRGDIIQCQTETMDYDLILEKIKEIRSKFNIIQLGYDDWNSAWIIPQTEKLGIECVKFQQNAKKFNMPLKVLEKLIIEQNINLSDNKAFLWNMRNVKLYVDGNGNIKIMKNKSKDSVDGAVSLGMAIGVYMEYIYGPEKIALDAFNNAFKN